MAKLYRDISKEPDRIEKFNPYHDRLGRFSSAGGAASFTYKPGHGKKYDNAIQSEKDRPLRESSAKTAKTAVSKAEKAEKRITKDLSEITKKTGGTLEGLDHRLKTEKSLSRKLVSECKELSEKLGREVTPDQAVKKMYDINRYTVSNSEERLADTVSSTLQSLEKQGYTVKRVKNTLKDTNAAYRGINCVLQSEDGAYFELQFHTKKSLEVKETNHKLYEVERKDSTPKERKEQLKKKMAENAKSIPTPKNIESIASLDTLPIFKSAGPLYSFYDYREMR